MKWRHIKIKSAHRIPVYHQDQTMKMSIFLRLGSTVFLFMMSVESRAQDISFPSVLSCQSNDGRIKNVSNIRQTGYQYTAIVTDKKTKNSCKIKVSKDVVKTFKNQSVKDEAGNTKAHVKRRADKTYEVKTEAGRIYICK